MDLSVTSTEYTTVTGTSAFVPAPATPYQGDIARYWNDEAR
ncbi:SAM-dependent methyltransferase, partial [Streptomyces sp. NPDC057674]